MRKLILATAIASAAVVPLAASPADAQTRRDIRQEQRECNRELRNADTRREYNREARECAREIREARQDYRRNVRRNWRDYRRYDWNRYEPRYGAYYADNYYRDGRYYQVRRLNRYDRIYRGRDGRYYCRRSDGTTGLIIGAGIGALIGNSLDNGRSSVLGTLIGGAAGAAIGREIARGNVRCR